MARSGWLGLQLPRLTNRPRSVAAVLSGGGSRASFQIGALAHLYDHEPEFAPSMFVGSSAGAILAAGLAQYSDRDRQRDFVEQVHEVWTAMKTSDDMFTPRPWLERLQAQAPTLLDLVRSAGQPARPVLPFWRSHAEEVPVSPPSPVGPLELALTPDEEEASEWSLEIVAQLAGLLGKLPRLGTELSSIRQGFEKTRSMYRPGPMLANLLDPEVFDPARVAESGNLLRVAIVGLESGQLRYMRDDGVITDRDDVPVDDVPHHLTTGVLASCSIPGVFRPVPLGDETYVDGGARENLPAELAIGHLQADRSYIISSTTMGVPPRRSMADADIISVVMRATEILIDESVRDELAYAHSAGAVVIQPLTDIHDAMTVRPGLIAMNIDYGWSRAALTVQEAETDVVDLVEEAFAARLRAYRLERRLIRVPGDVSTKLRLMSAKRDLKEIIGRIPTEILPRDAGLWWARWEAHAEGPTEPAFWVD